MIDLKELYWAAGFIEGEGTFGSARGRPPKCGGLGAWSIQLSANQVSLEPLERLQRMLGGTIYKYKKISAWVVCARRAFGMMMMFWPLMSQRRRAQIELVISRWKSNQSQTGPNHSAGVRSRCIKLSKSEVELIRSSTETISVLAQRWGTSTSNISRIKTGQSWRTKT